MRNLRRGFVLGTFVLTVLMGVSSAPATAAAPLDAHDRTSGLVAADSCAGPCPVFIIKKGSGSGRVWSTPDTQIDCGVACEANFQDTDEIFLNVSAAAGSTLLMWENCPHSLADFRCRIPPGASQGLVICPVFVPTGSTAPVPGGCPPQFPQCSDNFDNDANGLVDYPSDPGCSSAGDNEEYTPKPPPPPPAPARWPAKCTIPGSPFGERIVGTPKNDVICGGGGNDRIYGGGGNDTIVGGKGKDQLYGQSGNDLLIARDRVRDVVNGGPGSDRARVDAIDRRLAVERRV